MSTIVHSEQPRVPGARLWAGVLLAPAAWTVAELLGYVLVARACDGGSASIAARAGVTQDIVAIGLGIVAAIGLVIAVGNWQRVRDTTSNGEPAAWGRAEFMALAGVVASALFLLGIVFFALPPLFGNACNQVR